MGELYGIIQRHLDRYGVREAALARLMGTSSQTLNSWKTRGVRQLPTRPLLEAAARETRTPYGVVLRAALVDAGYLTPESVDVLDRQPEPHAEPGAVVERRTEPHSTPVTEADIAAGAGLPLAAPGHRRSKRSSGTTSQRHTS